MNPCNQPAVIGNFLNKASFTLLGCTKASREQFQRVLEAVRAEGLVEIHPKNPRIEGSLYCLELSNIKLPIPSSINSSGRILARLIV